MKFSVVNKSFEGEFLLFMEPFGFLRMVVLSVVTMSYTWHFAKCSKLSNFLESLGKVLVISSEEIELTGEYDSWWILLQNFI